MSARPVVVASAVGGPLLARALALAHERFPDAPVVALTHWRASDGVPREIPQYLASEWRERPAALVRALRTLRPQATIVVCDGAPGGAAVKALALLAGGERVIVREGGAAYRASTDRVAVLRHLTARAGRGAERALRAAGAVAGLPLLLASAWRWRRRGLLVLLVLLGIACRREHRPDVFLIVLDAVRADHLSAYGYARPTTPTLDALAAEGVLYQRAISAGTWTVTGHASLFTGRLPTSHGAYRAAGALNSASALDASVDTLAGHLGAAGWDTAAFAANRAYLDPAFGMAHGFGRYETENLYPAKTLARRVVRWLGKESRRPAFVFLNVLDAHEPYAAVPPYDRLFPGKLDHVGNVNRDYLATGKLPDPAVLAHCISQYDGELRYMDDQLATIFAELRHEGRWDDALVVVTADHGELFGEHGLLGHGALPWDALVHVPLIVKYPRGARRGVVDTPVSLVDVAPTILATLRVSPLPGAQGAPLWERSGPVIAEEPAADGAVARAAYDDGGHVLLERDGRAEWYDLATDPGEERPRAVADGDPGARLAAAVATRLAGMDRARRGPVASREPKVQEKLRALGYVE